MKHRIEDKEYIKYIESLPCYLCGHLPMGNRKIYNEYTDKWTVKPCKNTAHHVDTDRMRRGNDHRVLPLCSHYTVSGTGTSDCHAKVHGEGEYKTDEKRKEFVGQADIYYKAYLLYKEEKEKDNI